MNFKAECFGHEENAPCCKAMFRYRRAQTRLERLIEKVVGTPIHLDVVLAKPQSSSARFCFSAYVKQTFEMCLMSKEQILDDAYVNHSIDITGEEYDRCMKYMLELVDRKTRYDYFDALVLMPMAPKGKESAPKFASIISPLLQDVQHDERPKKVFCSQSVVLMMRECLDGNGMHASLVERMQGLNSRLVSPKMVYDIMREHLFTRVITNEELMRIGMDLEQRGSSGRGNR